MTSQHREEDKQTDYVCGHNSKPVFIDGRVFSMAHYMVWKETVGFEGTNEMCYRCYCKEARE